MTQDEKELLLKDLNARVLYDVKIRVEYPFLKEEEWHPEILYWSDLQRLCMANTSIILEEFKPYLFPMSSMTDEQKSYLYYNTKFDVDRYGDLITKFDEDNNYFYTDLYDYLFIIDWLNKNHFDYRGLIEKGLAIDATGKNIY